MRYPKCALAALTLLVACGPASSDDDSSATKAAAPEPVQAVSLLGDSLRTLPLPAETRTRYEQQLAQAKTAFDHTPSDADSIIWYARRLAYLGRHREALDVYTKGIAQYPDNPWLYRHRGHRYISVREFDRAVADLTRAGDLVRGRPDEVEPDGEPNALGIPTSTLQFNIWYHLGLTDYLRGNYAKAYADYVECMKVSKNDDSIAAVSDWMWMTLMRMNRNDEAAKVLERITPK
ncbi:MAG: tetratricopeptide repeat protein, partial [Longimicrobiales bacterium]